VTLAEGETKKVKLKVKLKGPKAQQEDPDEPPKKDQPPPPPPPEPSKVPGAVVLSGGIAILIAGGAFAGVAASSASNLNKVCTQDPTGPNKICPPSARGMYDEGRLFTGLSEGFIVGGTVALGVGIALLVVASQKPKPVEAPKDGKDKVTIRFTPSAPGADLAGAGLVGRF
jgi:hypothetical protein